MIESSTVLIVGLIIIIILFIIIAFYFRNTAPPSALPQDPSIYTSQYDGFVFWGPLSSQGLGERGLCKLYNFPATVDPSGTVCQGTSKSVLGQISSDTAILDTKDFSELPGCFSVDQIVVRKATRTCMALPNTTTPPAASCVRANGERVPLGGKDVFYTSQGCDQATPPCGGIFGLYGVGYSVDPGLPPPGGFPVCYNPVGMRCLKAPADLSIVIVDLCSVTDEEQLFYTIKVDETGAPSKTGMFSQIALRSNGACLTASADRTNLILDPNCTNISWITLPQLIGTVFTAPQQTIFIGDLNGIQIDDIFSSTTIDMVIFKLINYGVKSIQQNANLLGSYFSYPTGSIITPVLADQIKRATTQYIDYTISNTMLFSSDLYTF